MGFLDNILAALGLKKSAEQAATAAAHAAAGTAPAPSTDDDDDDDDDDDGMERDYAMEAQDDMGIWNFDEDLEPYFLAVLKIEHAWEDTAKRDQLFAEHGVRDEQHWRQIDATMQRYMVGPKGQARWGGMNEIMQIKMDVQMKHGQEVILGGGTAALASELEPVEGITLEAWAKAQAGIAGGGDVNTFIAEMGIDKAKWDRVSAEWNDRMSRDTTGTIATEYSKGFMQGNAGAYGAAGAAGMAQMGGIGGGGDLKEEDAPITLDRYVEIMEAQNHGVQQGKDAAAILQSFGLTAAEWGQVGGWWGGFMARNMGRDPSLHQRFDELTKKYEEKYKGASADSDISF